MDYPHDMHISGGISKRGKIVFMNLFISQNCSFEGRDYSNLPNRFPESKIIIKFLTWPDGCGQANWL